MKLFIKKYYNQTDFILIKKLTKPQSTLILTISIVKRMIQQFIKSNLL